jgi:DSF synthase
MTAAINSLLSPGMAFDPGNFEGHAPSSSLCPQLRLSFDSRQRALWARWHPEPRPCFNPTLLDELRVYYDYLGRSQGIVRCREGEYPLEYAITASETPGVFSLGGDLDLFARAINAGDRAALLRYARACTYIVYRTTIGHDLPVTTVALVQGECLGGGFEGALSHDVIIAERSARFGFPEIHFNLFPGMGAYSLLERRVGRRMTDELLGSGAISGADDMRALGLVDVVVEDGQGEVAVFDYIGRRTRSRNGLAALALARRRVQRIDLAELNDIAEVWVDGALKLTPRDLRLMHRLVSRQGRIAGSGRTP